MQGKTNTKFKELKKNHKLKLFQQILFYWENTLMEEKLFERIMNGMMGRKSYSNSLPKMVVNHFIPEAYIVPHTIFQVFGRL